MVENKIGNAIQSSRSRNMLMRDMLAHGLPRPARIPNLMLG